MSTPITPAAPAAPATPTPEASAPVSEQSQAPVENQDASADDMDADLAASEIDQAQADGKLTEKQAQDLKKKYKIKVDGEESEFEFDPSDEKQVTRIIQMAKAFEKRGGEFTKAQQQLLAKMQEMDENPEDYYSKRGVDLDAWAVERLQKKVQELEKSPEQKQQEALMAELEKLRKEKADAETEKEKIANERARDEQAKIIQDEITAAIDAVGSKIPKGDPYFLQQMSAYMLQQMAKGNVDISVQDTLKVLEGDMKKNHKSLYDRMDEDSILEFLGEENFERIRKKRYQQKKSAAANTQTTTAKQVVKDTGSKQTDFEKPKKTMKDFFGKV